MITLLSVLAVISLLDSTSMIPICAVPLAAILGGSRPVLGTGSFLAGVFLVYALTGAVLLAGLDMLFDTLEPVVARWWNHPNTLELVLQLTVGAIMLAFSWRLARVREGSDEADAPDALTPGGAFVLGGSLTVAGLPGAFPYFGAIEQILRADLGHGASGLALLFYNLVFLAPLASLLAVRLLLPGRSEVIFRRVAALADRWGRRFIVATLTILGLVFIADGIAWLGGVPILSAK